MDSPISFHKEFLEIMEALQEKDGALRFRYINATEQNLRECANDKPLGIHFAMHGFNTKTASKTQIIKDSNQFKKD